jgi:hypothetical protein
MVVVVVAVAVAAAAAVAAVVKAAGRHTTHKAGLGDFFKKMVNHIMHGQYIKKVL